MTQVATKTTFFEEEAVVLTRAETIEAMYGEKPDDFLQVDESDEIIFGWQLYDEDEKPFPKEDIKTIPQHRLEQLYDEEGEV